MCNGDDTQIPEGTLEFNSEEQNQLDNEMSSSPNGYSPYESIGCIGLLTNTTSGEVVECS